MSIVVLQSAKKTSDKNFFWSQGYSPFFLGACMFSIVAMLLWALMLWTLVHKGTMILPISAVSVTQWHAQQMIFGYSFAVIAGFLLTAVPNWTNTAPVSGKKLMSVFSLWLIGRLASLFSTQYLELAAIGDVSFGLLLLFFIAKPIVITKNWQQLAVLAKVLLLLTFNILFYLSALKLIKTDLSWILTAGLLLIIGLILTISARVFPNFVRIGVGYECAVAEPKQIRSLSLIFFLIFFFNEIIFLNHTATQILASILFVIYSCRLFYWHTPGIWNKPLLWSLYLANFFINLGFLFLAISDFAGTTKLLAMHCMAIGGIGFATLGFMVRVALGHSGKNIHKPPLITSWALRVLVVSFVFRVFMPLILPLDYHIWILISQLLWVCAFLFVIFACFVQDLSKLKSR